MNAVSPMVMLDRDSLLESDKIYWAVRRGQDVLLSSLALLLLLPVMALICVIILIDSPGAGPVFMQTRIGRDGKPFTLYKFRSMRPGAEQELEGLLPCNEMDGPVFKMRSDPRVTRFGRLLRRTCMDELPQLWNVLKGDMSLVGPRPGLPREVEQYDSYARQRLLITPGLTCYWQVRPDKNSLSFEKWVELDLRYIRERSFLTDWRIIWKTLGAVVRRNGM